MTARGRLSIVGLLVALVIVGLGVWFALNGHSGGSDRVIAIQVSGSTMTPETISVSQSDHVTLNITVDRTEEIHIHGYDILKTIETGKTGVLMFTADRTGSFPIEIETSGRTIGNLVVNP